MYVILGIVSITTKEYRTMNNMKRIENGYVVTTDKGVTSKYATYKDAISHLYAYVTYTAIYSTVTF